MRHDETKYDLVEFGRRDLECAGEVAFRDALLSKRSQQVNALSLQSRLQNPADAQVMEVMLNGSKVYRVMMGPYASKEDAKNMLSKLASIGIPDSKITHN